MVIVFGLGLANIWCLRDIPRYRIMTTSTLSTGPRAPISSQWICPRGVVYRAPAPTLSTPSTTTLFSGAMHPTTPLTSPLAAWVGSPRVTRPYGQRIRPICEDPAGPWQSSVSRQSSRSIYEDPAGLWQSSVSRHFSRFISKLGSTSQNSWSFFQPNVPFLPVLLIRILYWELRKRDGMST